MPERINREKLYTTVACVSSLLADQNYKALNKFNSRMTANEIKKAIEDYGRTPVPLPKKGLSGVSVVEIKSSSPTRWSVWVPVYTKEEGMSDLTLELTLIDSNTDLYGIEIDDLHVL
jgi:hypothetical protein